MDEKNYRRPCQEGKISAKAKSRPRPCFIAWSIRTIANGSSRRAFFNGRHQLARNRAYPAPSPRTSCRHRRRSQFTSARSTMRGTSTFKRYRSRARFVTASATSPGIRVRLRCALGSRISSRASLVTKMQRRSQWGAIHPLVGIFQAPAAKVFSRSP